MVPPVGVKALLRGLRPAVCRREASVEILILACLPSEGGGRAAAAAEAPLLEKRIGARRRLTEKVRGGRWARAWRRGKMGGVMEFLRRRRGRPGGREVGEEGAGWGLKAGCKGESGVRRMAGLGVS